jgi:hypothetical protein
MDFVNETKVQAGWTLGFQPDGRELLVVAVKATYQLRANGNEPVLCEVQEELVESDTFTGEPGFSATKYEVDYAHWKPQCDVLVNGSAHSPGGRPTSAVTVGLRVGVVNKRFNVVGDRQLVDTFLMVAPSPVTPFTTMPISYDRAYGGTDKSPKKPDQVMTYLKNPIGVGYYPVSDRQALSGKPLPNTEQIGIPVTSVSDDYLPMSFSPLGRNFAERIPYAGTYNDDWLKTRAPFFPDNFDYRYFQSAPADQQIPHPNGGEEIVLENLTPEGVTTFCIPQKSMPVLFIPYRGKDRPVDAVMDTILIEPEQNRFMVTWRASLPLQRDCFEIKQTIAGEMPPVWHRARRIGNKPYYPNLGEYIRATRGKRRPPSQS